MRSVTTLFFVFFSWHAVAQLKQMNWGIDYRQKAGFLIAHRGALGHLPQDHAFAGELSFFMRTKGRKQWHQACGFPYLGVTFFGGSVGNNKILGKHWGIFGFSEFPFIRSKHYELLFKLGSGLGYSPNVFDGIYNPKNTGISSRINILVSMALKSSFIFKRSNLSLSIDLTHFSNAATSMPNHGINVPYISLGYGYTIHEAPSDTSYAPTVFPFRKWLINTTFIGSWREIFPTGGKKYPIFGVSTSLRRFVKPKLGYEISFDLMSKQSVIDYTPQIQKTQWDILQMGLYVGYLAPLDQFHFLLGMGVYIKDKYRLDDPLYHRLGIRYYFKNGLNMNLTLKSHWAKADYAELGLGYTFNFRKKCARN